MRFIRNRNELAHMLIIHAYRSWSIPRVEKAFSDGAQHNKEILRAHEERRDNGHDVMPEGLNARASLTT